MAYNPLLLMLDLPQQRITVSTLNLDGKHLSNAEAKICQLPSASLQGLVYNNHTVTTGQTIRKNGRNFLEMQCNTCEKISLKYYFSVVGNTAGCRRCGLLKIARFDTPKWLISRCISAQQRCCNTSDLRYADYGGRGILFKFGGPTEMAVYIQETLGLHRELQINRIYNNGHYEAGNLEYCRAIINMNNQRGKQATVRAHAFKLLHPKINYADSTLVGLFQRGFTNEEVVQRFYQVSSKPKGVYGTYSMPDQEIASLLRDS